MPLRRQAGRLPYFGVFRGIFSCCPTFSLLRFTPGLASAMSLALMLKSFAIFAAESPLDTVMISGGDGWGTEPIGIVGGAAFASRAAAGFAAGVGTGFESSAGAALVNTASA